MTLYQKTSFNASLVTPALVETCLHIRSLPSIIWTCLVTIFLCIWVAYHPDVPERSDESRWRRYLRRIGFMIMALLSPEVILVKAFNDLDCSRKRLGDVIREYPSCGWTQKHAFFAYMGGFRLIRRDGSQQLLYGDAFFDGIVNREIELPSISEKEIQDRSKEDEIGKALTVVHTLWFAHQLAVRVKDHLPVTELELTTLGHVVFNLFIYLCWWYKPKNVRIPVKVHPSAGEEQGQDDVKKDDHEDGIVEDVERRTDREDIHKAQAADTVHSGTSKERIGRIPGEQSPDAADCEASQVTAVLESKNELVGTQEQEQPTHMRFTFARIVLLMALSLIGGLFGAIHCLAWNSPFPTHTETSVWRISALVVTTSSEALFLIFITLAVIERHTGCPLEALYWRIAFLISLFSSCARVCLLVIALLALRALPISAYVAPPWYLYIPHIS